MNVNRQDPLDLLRPATGTCQAAAFTSYTFNAGFFEETVLASLLPIDADPEVSPRQFLDEGRYRLQCTPVTVIVDPHHFRGGRRLPYDLVLASDARTFHPKVAVVLFADHARLLVGSGNLTSQGYGNNAELNALLKLDYGQHAGLLGDVKRFFVACGAHGEAWDRLVEYLQLQLDAVSDPKDVDDDGAPALLETATSGPLLDRFFARIPANAKIHAIGVLAPYHQEDDAAPESAVIERAISAAGDRASRQMKIDVGLCWENNRLSPPGDPPVDTYPLEGELWAWREGASGKQTVSWFLVGDHVGHTFNCVNAAGVTPRATRTMRSQLESSSAWLVDHVQASAPPHLLERLAKRRRLHIWCLPEFRLENGRTFRRPLHGKLIAVATSRGKVKETHLLLGSPNATTSALLRPGANVEAALHLVLPSRLRLPDLCSDLVECPREFLDLTAPDYPALKPNPARWVKEAWFDASSKKLTVEWQKGAPSLTLIYPTSTNPHRLFEGKPGPALEIDDFDLDRSCSELLVRMDGDEGRVPIRVIHLNALPSMGPPSPPDFEEFVSLFSGRYCAPHTPGGGGPGRGEGIDSDGTTASDWLPEVHPKDVFRAIFGRIQELADPDASLGAFDLLLDGPTGLRAFLRAMLKAAGLDRLDAGEAWLYGQELARGLGHIDLLDTPINRAKMKRLQSFAVDVQTQLAPLKPAESWSSALAKFYGASS